MEITKKTITLCITEYCNLACTYCYEHHKTDKRMRYENAIRIIEEELTAPDPYEEVTIDFFGGEPFTEFELIKECYQFIRSRNWPKKLICFAVTNGTLVHGEIKNWLAQNKDFFGAASVWTAPGTCKTSIAVILLTRSIFVFSKKRGLNNQ